MQYKNKKNFAFTLVEVLVGSAVFLVVATAAYSAFSNLFKLASANQATVLAVALAGEQFEIVRNLPYMNVGLTNGIPHGILPQTQTLVRGGYTFTVTLTIRNINLSTSTVQASDKLINVNVTCTYCQNFTPVNLTGQISPANLQSASDGGAVVIHVYDSAYQPLKGATVVLQSLATSSVTNTDVTDNNGVLNIIGVPAGSNMYRITVGGGEYSTDRTYPIGGVGNPDPINLDLNVNNQEISPASFYVDRLSDLHFSSVSPLCAPVGNFDFSMTSSKNIGVGVPKYSSNLSTNGSGILNLNQIEWDDAYVIIPTDTGYDLAGINPFSPLKLNAGNSQNVQFVALPTNPESLMVSVTDSVTKLPISGATIHLVGTGYDVTKTTGQGYMTQTDWSGGAGQDNFTDTTRYFSDNGGVDTATSSGNILLRQIFGLYDNTATGTLMSSIFDTGTSSNFYTFSWNPDSQPPLSGSASVKFQFATNPTSTSTPWTFLGPDGTSDTYYSIPGSPINAIHNGNQFARYLTYVTTEMATVTPSVNDVSFAYTSDCIPPGQVLFQGLSVGDYTLTVSKTGYTAWSETVSVVAGWQEQGVELVP